MPWYDTFDALAAARLPRLEILREEPMSRHTTFRIGGPARRFVPGGQDDLAAKEAVRPVVEGGQGSVAETEEPHIKLALVALDALALHIHLAL